MSRVLERSKIWERPSCAWSCLVLCTVLFDLCVRILNLAKFSIQISAGSTVQVLEILVELVIRLSSHALGGKRGIIHEYLIKRH